MPAALVRSRGAALNWRLPVNGIQNASSALPSYRIVPPRFPILTGSPRFGCAAPGAVKRIPRDCRSCGKFLDEIGALFREYLEHEGEYFIVSEAVQRERLIYYSSLSFVD